MKIAHDKITHPAPQPLPLGAKVCEDYPRLPPSRPTATAALRKMGLLSKKAAPSVAKEY